MVIEIQNREKTGAGLKFLKTEFCNLLKEYSIVVQRLGYNVTIKHLE